MKEQELADLIHAFILLLNALTIAIQIHNARQIRNALSGRTGRPEEPSDD